MLLEELKLEKEKMENKNQYVIDKIVSYFKEEIKSKKFEDYLKEKILDGIKDNEKSVWTEVELWDWHDGCSNTYFRIGNCEWKSEDNRYYNDIRLSTIREEVVHQLLIIATTYLDEQGLSYWVEDERGRLDYPHYKIHIDISKI